MPQGQGQIIAGADLVLSSDHFDDRGTLQTGHASRSVGGSAYVEYGLLPRLTLIAAPTIQSQSALTINDESGVNGSAFGARLGLYASQAWVASVQALLIPPVGVRAEPTSVDLRVMIGHSFSVGGVPMFVSLEPGARVGAAGYAPQARFDATLGARILSRYQIFLQTFASYEPKTTTQVRTAYDKLQASLLYDLSPTWTLQVGCFRTVAGRNAERDVGPLLAAWHRF